MMGNEKAVLGEIRKNNKVNVKSVFKKSKNLAESRDFYPE
jgi:hypothetical protein